MKDNGLSLAEITQLAQAVVEQAPSDNAVFIKTNNTLLVSEGVELNPIAKRALKIQMWALTFLFSGFGFLVFATFVNMLGEQATARMQEFKLKTSLGASYSSLFVSGVIEALPMISVFVVLSKLIATITMEAASSGSVFRAYFGDNISIDFGYWIAAVSINLGLFLLAIFLNLSTINSKNTFTRSQQGSQTKLQSKIRNVNLTIQLAIAIATFAYTLTIFIKEVKNNEIVNVNGSALEITTKQTGKSVVSLSLQNKHGEFEDSTKLALSSTQFTTIDSTNFQYKFSSSDNASALPVNGTFVSANYFEVLKIPHYKSEPLVGNYTYINENFADYLIKESEQISSPQELIGKPIVVEYFPATLELSIAGIVANAPHFGIQSNKSVIYVSYERLPSLISTKLVPVFYSANNHEEQAFSTINDWVASNTMNIEPYDNSKRIFESVYELNLGGRFLFVASAVMSILIVMLLSLSLYYRMTEDITRDRRKYGTFLALGASKFTTYKMNNTNILVILISAVPIALVLTYLVEHQLSYFASIDLFNINFLVAFLVVALLVKIFNLAALSKILKSSIVNLLKST
ncbi:ABC transporter permease [Thalassotalea fusca]